MPPEYVGCDVWVRAETRLVRLFNQRFAPIAVVFSVFVGTLVLCLCSAVLSFRKVASIDPALVFRT